MADFQTTFTDSGASFNTVFGSVTSTGGASDYNDLANKPQIEAVELIGNKTFDELGMNSATNLEIAALFS